MPSQKISDATYLPLLDIRPAEIVALEELPNKDKDALLPVFRLRPWVAANKLGNAIQRLKSAYGERSCFLELGEPEPVAPEKYRRVHQQLDELRSPEDGYKNWVDFFRKEGCENFNPVLQVLGDPTQVAAQAKSLLELDRGLLIHIDANRINVEEFARFISKNVSGGAGIYFVLDFFKQSHDFLHKAVGIQALIKQITDILPEMSAIAVSASSFPDGFTSITQQDIYERKLFNKLSKPNECKLLYSDRGSARAERQTGGGGLPAPRIDFARANEWVFFRQDTPVNKPALGYQRQASELMQSPFWDHKLKLWGCQMIEKTAAGDDTGITSANRSTAARINIHLHQQLWYGNSQSLYDTDEEWED